MLPWLRQKISKFENDDGQAGRLAAEIIESGIIQAKLNHARTLKERQDKKKQAAESLLQREKDKVRRREDRANERILRDKKAAKAQLRAQINKHIVDKGEV